MILYDRKYIYIYHVYIYISSEHQCETFAVHVHLMSDSSGPSHKLPVCPQTKRKITPKPSKFKGIAAMQEPQIRNLLAAVLPTMDKRMSENSALKMSASSLEENSEMAWSGDSRLHLIQL